MKGSALVVIACLAMLPSPGVAPAAAAASAAEAPTIALPRAAPTTRTVVMEEAWRVGADPDEEFMIGVPGGAVGDLAGNVYLLDTQQQQVLKFGPGGAYLGRICRQGEGPGEIEGVYHLKMWAPGTLGLLRGFPAGVILVGTDGRPAGQIAFSAAPAAGEPGMLMLHGFERRDGHLLAIGGLMRWDGRAQQETSLLAAFDAQGRETHRLDEQAHSRDFSRAIVVDEARDEFVLQRWALGAGGEVYLAPERDAWLIEVRDASGRPARRLARDVAPHRRTPQEMAAAKRNWSFSSDTGLPEISYRLCETERVIDALAWRDGELWVATGELKRGLAAGAAASYDIVDPAGRLLEQRTYLMPFDPDQDGLVFLDARRALRLKGLHSAVKASLAGLTVKQGDETLAAGEGGEGGDEAVEVILYTAEAGF